MRLQQTITPPTSLSWSAHVREEWCSMSCAVPDAGAGVGRVAFPSSLSEVRAVYERWLAPL